MIFPILDLGQAAGRLGGFSNSEDRLMMQARDRWFYEQSMTLCDDGVQQVEENPLLNAKPSFREELQRETDEWLK